MRAPLIIKQSNGARASAAGRFIAEAALGLDSLGGR